MGAQDAGGESGQLAKLLSRHRTRLVRFLEKEASGLRRYEDAEDVAQGVHLHALRVADRFEYRGEKAFLGWLFAVARRYIADRNAYWHALKRDAGPMLRVTFGADSAGAAGVAPAADATGPSTRADRAEQLDVATRAIAALPERDRHIAQMVAGDRSIETMADALGVSYAAAQRARLRAIDRFRKVYELARREQG